MLITPAFALILLVVPARAQAQGEAAKPPPAQGEAAKPPPAQGEAAKPPAPGEAAKAEPAKDASSFSTEQLEQIVAPIALHPDSLLSMILMASTYPLEIVEAARWAQKNSSLKGKALEDALKQQDWDPSVKSICGFPTVLKQMNENLDWTQDLGDAFLGQKKELMDTVQKMRRKALEAGNLKSTEQQKVTDEDKIIVIQSANPEVVYVPSYPPTVVYGSAWAYPTYYYPPMYAPYPPGAALFTFGVGVAWGAAVWGNCNWGGSDVDIDINKQNNFNNRTEINPNRDRGNRAGDRAGGKESFRHDPAHRKGANYKNPQTAQKYGGAPGSNRVSKDQARGYQGGGASGGRGSGAKPSTRPSGGAGGARPSTGAGGGARPSQTPSAGSRPSSSTRGGSSALSGSRSPGMDRSASARGASSRGGGGGGSRGGGRSGGGGGRGGGGGGRRR